MTEGGYALRVFAEFARTQALSGLGAHKRASKLAERALDYVPADAYDVRGALTLTTGYTESVLGGDATAALDEAAGLAEHVEYGNRNFLLFSPANVVLWRISSALERGDHAEAARLAATVDPAALTIDSRRTTFLIEHARALYGIRRPDEEVLALLVQSRKAGTYPDPVEPVRPGDHLHDACSSSTRSRGS